MMSMFVMLDRRCLNRNLDTWNYFFLFSSLLCFIRIHVIDNSYINLLHPQQSPCHTTKTPPRPPLAESTRTSQTRTTQPSTRTTSMLQHTTLTLDRQSRSLNSLKLPLVTSSREVILRADCSALVGPTFRLRHMDAMTD